MNALYVESAAFSPDGLKIVAVSRDETCSRAHVYCKGGSKGIVRVWSVHDVVGTPMGKCEQMVVVGGQHEDTAMAPWQSLAP